MTDIIATMTPRPGRRFIGAGVQVALAVLLFALALGLPPGNIVWQAVLVGGGLLALLGAWRLYQATALRLELTESELRDSAGRVLARVEDVRGVDRGAFAFKPSNGFLLSLSRPGPRIWVPGLWWRIGRFVGVGGVTPRHEAKLMAEMLSAMISSRKDG